jgi:aryl-alcohol dehydrogenase-like predicted oxidoreductase
VRRAVESSLRRLGTEWIDLYQLHGPDARTPVEETLSVLDDLVQEGKIRYIGTSMHSAWEVVEAQFVAEIKGYTRFVSTQAQYNILHRAPEQELVRACRRYAVGLIPFFPLEQGLLTGKYRRDASPQGARLTESRGALTEERFTVVEALESFGRERGVGVLDVALGWLVQMPTVATVIAGATTPEQISANVAATEWEPTLDDLKILDTISPPPAQALHRQRPAWTR